MNLSNRTDPTERRSAAEQERNAPKTEQAESKQDSAAKDEIAKTAERKRLEARQAQKKDEEKQAQHDLMQAFYLEKLKIDLSPEKLKESMKVMAEHSIEHLMNRDGTSLQMEWKSELHQISLQISEQAYDKFNAELDSQDKKRESS